MKTIEQMLDEAVRKGDLIAMTLWQRADGWQANVKRRIRGQEGWACEARANPAEALHAALTTMVSTDVIRELPRVPTAAAPAPVAVETADDEDIFG